MYSKRSAVLGPAYFNIFLLSPALPLGDVVAPQAVNYFYSAAIFGSRFSIDRTAVCGRGSGGRGGVEQGAAPKHTLPYMSVLY